MEDSSIFFKKSRFRRRIIFFQNIRKGDVIFATYENVRKGLTRTNLHGSRRSLLTLISLRTKYQIRKGTKRQKRPSGRIDRTVSSKSRVKSNPPRQCPAYGPKVSSIRSHDAFASIFARSYLPNGCIELERCKMYAGW